MPNSSSPPSSPSGKTLVNGPKPENSSPDISSLNHLPYNHKKTRELPNLSDCHGCGRRINYSNPKERLQPLESVWRIVLLCKECTKQVNSGRLCPCCFKPTSKSLSDCFDCGNCHRIFHKSCIPKHDNLAPQNYCSNKVELRLECIDCWVPDMLRRSIRGGGKRFSQKGLPMPDPNAAGCKNSEKGNDGERSLVEVATEAKCVLKKKVAVAAKAKDDALRKAMAAKDAVELASNALDLVANKYHDDKEKKGLVGRSDDGSSSRDSSRLFDDAALAFRLHHMMNSSPRILRNLGRMKSSCSDLWKTSDPFGGREKSMDFKESGEGGKYEGFSNSLENRIHGGNISTGPTCVVTNQSCTSTDAGGLKPGLVTYKRNNRKGKERQLSGIEAIKSHTSTDSRWSKPELVTYKRNRSKRDECQRSDSDHSENCTYMVSGGLKPDIVTYKRDNRKRNECQQCYADAIGCWSPIEFDGSKPELFSCEQNSGKREECEESVLEANGSISFSDSAMLKAGLITYMRNNRRRKGCIQSGVHTKESCRHIDSGGLNQGLVTYKRKNRKRKEYEQCFEGGKLAENFVEMCICASDSSSVTESLQCSLQDERNAKFHANDADSFSTPDGCISDVGAQGWNSISLDNSCLLTECKRLTDCDVVAQDKNDDTCPGRFCLKYGRRVTTSHGATQDKSIDPNLDRFSLKYSKRMKCPGEGLCKEDTSVLEKTNGSCVSFQTAAQDSPEKICCSQKHNSLPGSECAVNTAACFSSISSFQGEE